MKVSQFLSGALLAGAAQAQVGAYGQCGGYEWTGLTTCVSGYYCFYYSEWYSQCIPGTATTTSTSTVASTTKSTSSTSSTTLTTSTKKSTTSTTSTTSTSSTSSSSSVKTTSTTRTSTSATASATGFKWLGVDESGAEFGSGDLPGVWGTDFIFPSTTSIATLVGQGYNIFRVPFLMERMVPTTLTGPFWEAYLANYTAVINDITSLGAWAVVDPHNFGRYYGAIITDTVGFGTFWANLASQYVSNSKVIFDTNNEYNTEDQTLVFNLNQAAITSIRGVGATSQYIFAEGNAWSGAWDWTTVNTNLVNLTDPSNKLIYEMHQYLDSDDSGTSDVCVNNTIGYDRVIAATQWLKANNKLGVIGEFAGGANSVCLEAVQGMLSYLEENTNVWLGALWWGGGPWWGDYIFAFEPPSSTGYNYYDSALLAYAP